MKKRLQIDWLVVGIIAAFVIGVVLSIAYGIFYWNNCAFVPLKDAPSLCFANHR